MQYRHRGNPLAHYDGTTEEIIQQCRVSAGQEYEGIIHVVAKICTCSYYMYMYMWLYVLGISTFYRMLCAI